MGTAAKASRRMLMKRGPQWTCRICEGRAPFTGTDAAKLAHRHIELHHPKEFAKAVAARAEKKSRKRLRSTGQTVSCGASGKKTAVACEKKKVIGPEKKKVTSEKNKAIAKNSPLPKKLTRSAATATSGKPELLKVLRVLRRRTATVMKPAQNRVVLKAAVGKKRKPTATTKSSDSKTNSSEKPPSDPKALNSIPTGNVRNLRKRSCQSAQLNSSPPPSPVPVRRESASPELELLHSAAKQPAATPKIQRLSARRGPEKTKTDDFEEYIVEDPILLNQPSGFESGKSVEKILGVVDLEDKPIRYIVKWEGSNVVEPVASDVLWQQNSEMLLDFLESCLMIRVG
ncbi:uncharacterized protein LOC129597978 [Paramacrobiotus metropolitanus]|uniref:uncharacterized protein LOC129597978 n=1 Tax=Paramacrobiotus metropolitanus TaxID=2943436 RepID=UPI0024465D55|nr:uncharacterized protein LOC129597978 [Paramacrobiotus metropolitanus]